MWAFATAGVLLVREAGGRVTDVWGEEYTLTTRNLVATNGMTTSNIVQHSRIPFRHNTAHTLYKNTS